MATLADVFGAIDGLHLGYSEDYAVGGTVAALFYAEATCCFDVRVLSNHRNGLQLIHGVPVHFSQPQNALEHEAVRLAEGFHYDGTPLRVMSAEHLIAFDLKDRKYGWGYPSSCFVPTTVNSRKLDEILRRAGLFEKWQQWRKLDEIESPDAHRYASKRRWHEQNAHLPVKEKVAQLLQMQKHDLPLLARHRELKWWEKPRDIEP